MIFITGDTHGTIDWGKLNTTKFPEQKNLTRDDYVIILGDFGGVWDGGKQDKYILKTYDQRNFTTLFIDGNHENHDLLDKYPVEEWNGGKIHRITNNVIHLMRGQVFTIDGVKIFTMGGAESTDRAWRTPGLSWWAREMPSDQEYKEAVANLEKNDFKVDYILTHCAPEGYICRNSVYVYNRSSNRLVSFFCHLLDGMGIEFKHWYFGHYHGDEDIKGFGEEDFRFHLRYRRIEELKE